MKDVVTYCADVSALQQELIKSGRTSEEGNPVLEVIKTPVIYKDGHSLSLVRLVNKDDEEKLKLNSLDVLGTYEEVFADSEKMAKYTSVYSTDPYEEIDENGNKQMMEVPKKFGVFYD